VIKPKKSLHINLKYETHSGFRIECFKRGLSMQEVIEEFASRVANESNEVLRMMDQLVKDKQVKSVKRYTRADVDAIYTMLEEDNPLKGE